MSTVSAQAVITVTVEVMTGNYNDMASVDFIVKQAKAEGVSKVKKLLGQSGKIIGEPVCRIVNILEQAP